MSYFLLIVTFLMSDGTKGVSVTRIDAERECFQAMVAVTKAAPNISATCEEIKRGQ